MTETEQLDDTLETTEGQHALRFQRRLAHPPERIWRAITDPDERANWFPAYGPFEPSETDEPNLLVVPWHGGTLRFELSADGDGTLLVFTHEIPNRDEAALAAAGWDRTFVRLRAALEGEPIDEATSLEGWPEIHEGYAERWDVDPELGRQRFASHPTQRGE